MSCGLAHARRNSIPAHGPMLDCLAPFFTGPLRPFAERLHVVAHDAAHDKAPGDDWVTEALARSACAMNCSDRRALAAAWFRDYTMAVLPGALVAALLHRRRLPFDRAVVEIGADGRLLRLQLPDEGEQAHAALACQLSPLMNLHLPQVVAALAGAASVAPRLLWCTGGVAAAGIVQQLSAHPALAQGQRIEVLAWIGEAVSSDGHANAFHGAFRPGMAPVRRICCLNYRLPGEGGHCGTCPRLAASRATRDSGHATGATATTP